MPREQRLKIKMKGFATNFEKNRGVSKQGAKAVVSSPWCTMGHSKSEGTGAETQLNPMPDPHLK